MKNIICPALALFSIPLTAYAEPLNCDTLKHTNVPYQLSQKNQSNTSYIRQIYRQDNLYTTTFFMGNRKIYKTISQSSFDIETSNHKYTYSVPTDRYWFDQKISAYHSIRKGASTDEFEVTLKTIDEEDIPLGSCVFHTHHYSMNAENDTVTEYFEFWLSTELNAIVKSTTKVFFKHDGTALSSSIDANDITTDFVPFSK